MCSIVCDSNIMLLENNEPKSRMYSQVLNYHKQTFFDELLEDQKLSGWKKESLWLHAFCSIKPTYTLSYHAAHISWITGRSSLVWPIYKNPRQLYNSTV